MHPVHTLAESPNLTKLRTLMLLPNFTEPIALSFRMLLIAQLPYTLMLLPILTMPRMDIELPICTKCAILAADPRRVKFLIETDEPAAFEPRKDKAPATVGSFFGSFFGIFFVILRDWDWYYYSAFLLLSENDIFLRIYTQHFLQQFLQSSITQII
jgi:hypothetical protein